MSRKKKDLPLVEGIKIEGVAAEGNAIAHIDGGMVLFVPFGAPGDVADIQLTRRKKGYAEGRIVRLISPSEVRVEPRCSHFGVCGGCRWQHLPYSLQLECKQQQVVDALDRIAKVPRPEITPILGSDEIWAYRNKMEYTFSAKKWVTFEQLRSGEDLGDMRAAGLHIPGAFDKVLDIEACPLQTELGDQLRLFVKEFGKEHGLTFFDLRAQTGLLRTLMIRVASTGETMAVVCFGEDDPAGSRLVLDAVRERFPQLTSLMYVINTKANDSFADLDVHLHSGKPYIEEAMEDLRFRVGPKSFYQTNSHQALRLYTVARDLAKIRPDDLVYDLYTGTGTIACFVASRARHVIGIEYVEAAVADARVNAEVNTLDNTEFYAGDMKDILTADFIAEHGRPDVMIVDPPRAGMHADVVRVILDAAPRRIVYVSCNPATQARDVALLNERYDIEAVQPVDMFPHTQHVENVIALTLRQ